MVGTPSVYGPGSISLVLDPTNNDGTPSATVNVAASTGAVGFSNPLGTSDDITLATGSLTDGSFGTQPNGNPGVHFIETYTPAPGEAGFSVSPIGAHTSIEEFLFNTSTSRVIGTFADGSSYVVVNDGIGAADLLVPEPASITLLGADSSPSPRSAGIPGDEPSAVWQGKPCPPPSNNSCAAMGAI